jgi:hypothetical protein
MPKNKHMIQKGHGAFIQPWNEIEAEVKDALLYYPVKYNGGIYNTDILREVIESNPGKYHYTYNPHSMVINYRIGTIFKRMEWERVSKGARGSKWRPTTND